MLRQRLAEGPVIGTFLKLPRPEVVSLLRLAGFDFVIVDLEHAQIDEHECREVLQAARAEGLPAVVRVPELDRGSINRLLEAGAAGIQLPRTRTAADVDHLAALLRYPPEGSRSVSQAQPAARYGAEPLADYLRRSNDEVLSVGQFETADLAEDLASAVRGLDVAFIGSLDLSVDAGHPGDDHHPDVRALVTRVEHAASSTGRHLGVFAADAAAASAAVAAGYRYIAVGADLSMLRRGATDVITAIRDAA